MITIENINKSFPGVQALKNFSIHIKKGELLGLIGQNGAGKSTLMKIIIGLAQADDGRLKLGNAAEKITIGYAPEEPAVYEYLTGREFLQFTAELRQLTNAQAEIEFYSSIFNMEEKLHELIDNYSNGMRRKISLMSAMLGDPAILLLDEPTNGLDPQSIFELKKLLKEKSEHGTTVLFSSHILDTVEKICDRVGIIHQGELRACGSIAELTGGKIDLEKQFIQLISKAAITAD